MTEITIPKITGEYSYAVGKRKCSIATVRVYHKGSGRVMINGLDSKQYFEIGEYISKLLEPLKLAGLASKVDVSAKVEGGGKAAQAEAVRLGISRAVTKKEPENRTVLKKSGFLTRDSRVKERKKPGLKRARRSPQWSKR